MAARWTAEEDALLRACYADTPTANLLARLPGRSERGINARALKVLGLRKGAEYMVQSRRKRIAAANVAGVAHRFPTGHVPHNKGKSGISNAGSFQPGNIPLTELELGVTRWRKGYLWTKVRHVRDGKNSRLGWRPTHHVIWEAAHGPCPPGYVVVFLDGDPAHLALDNLACISRATRCWLNKRGYTGTAAPITRAAIALAELTLATARVDPNRPRRGPTTKQPDIVVEHVMVTLETTFSPPSNDTDQCPLDCAVMPSPEDDVSDAARYRWLVANAYVWGHYGVYADQQAEDVAMWIKGNVPMDKRGYDDAIDRQRIDAAYRAISTTD